ncbi:4'-phosphopantetheinyl transferase [Sulfitobacter aestuarii]|uniref:Enterobactin synthase component D n=1 Tax=Sulfitobacter aestuarii TaxID=2161676 RepID=A0ABW5U063_9RHOB
MIGSIAHDHVFVGAAVARLGRFAAIGVDIEPDEPLDAQLIGTICSGAEQRRIAGPDAPRLARVIFSAEEAAYNAQYMLSGALFGFDHLDLCLDIANQRFVALLCQPAGIFAARTQLHGRFGHAGRHLVTAVTIGQSAAKREPFTMPSVTCRFALAALAALSFGGALWQRSARHGELLDHWQALRGGLFAAYADVHAPTKWGSWGALRHLDDSNARWNALLEAQ